MSRATVLLVLAALSYGGCKAVTSESSCSIANEIATCADEQIEFPLHLPANITQLHIHSTKVKNINKDNFAQYNDLEVIDLSNCNITDIDPNTFTAQLNLDELNLAGNKEFSVEKTFISSQSLTKLNLSETGFKTIPENFFEELPNLEELDLSSTSLTEPPSYELLKLSNLSTLIISKDYKDELNNFCDDTNLQTIVFKTADGNNETHNCTYHKGKSDTTTTQQDIATVPTIIIVTQSKSNNDETTVDNTDVDQSNENNETTTESTNESTTIVDNSTEDKNNTVVNPLEESVQRTAEKSTENEQQQNQNENYVSTAEKKGENITQPEVLNRKNTTEIVPVVTTVETAIDVESETENVTQKTDEAVTENVAGQTAEPVTENVTDQTQSDNGAEATTTVTNIVNNRVIQVFSVNANSQKNNNESSVKMPADGAGDADNNTSEVTSSAVQSSGTNVVLGIILIVMVIGVIGFGYKYWKNRRSGYRNANTEETHEDGKELQTIVTHHTDPEQN